MGGPVAIAVRDPLGTVHCFDAWTADISAFFDSVEFLDGDPTHIDFLYRECALKDRLAPHGYGLVLGDMMNKVILTMQDYTTIGDLNGAGIRLSQENVRGTSSVVISMPQDPQFEEYLRFGNLLAADRIKKITRVSRLHWDQKGEIIEDEVEYGDVDQLIERYKDYSFWRVHIDTSPYTVENFNYITTGIKAMQRRVSELGFKLTEVDLEGWTEYISDMDYEEDVDEDE